MKIKYFIIVAFAFTILFYLFNIYRNNLLLKNFKEHFMREMPRDIMEIYYIDDWWVAKQIPSSYSSRFSYEEHYLVGVKGGMLNLLFKNFFSVSGFDLDENVVHIKKIISKQEESTANFKENDLESIYLEGDTLHLRYVDKAYKESIYKIPKYMLGDLAPSGARIAL